MLHLYAALAEKERALISERTKAALQRAKARGRELGNRGLPYRPEVAAARARSHAEAIAPGLRPGPMLTQLGPRRPLSELVEELRGTQRRDAGGRALVEIDGRAGSRSSWGCGRGVRREATPARRRSGVPLSRRCLKPSWRRNAL